jgi:V/A-type H+/Na+-transporting ATPase subunit K
MDGETMLAQVGPALALALPAIGSCFGCYIAGAASHAAMTKTEEGHGKLIGMASAPSSQSIYGFILMVLLYQAVNRGTISPIAAVLVGFISGTAIMISSICQGKVAATGIQASIKQPSVFGKTFVAVGILESFSLFIFVFTLMLL